MTMEQTFFLHKGNSSILKVGVGIDEDIRHLQRWHFPTTTVHAVLDLRAVIEPFNISRSSLSTLTALFLSRRLAKSRRRESWERKSLTRSQLNYAALDACACAMLYEKFIEYFPQHQKWARQRSWNPMSRWVVGHGSGSSRHAGSSMQGDPRQSPRKPRGRKFRWRSARS